MTTGRILRRIGPGFVLGYQVILMLASLGLLLWLTSAPGRAPSFSFDKVVPLWVPFGGWLGGITISIVGVATHTHDWNRQKYAYWHLARPLLGMLTGTVAVLIVLFVIKGVTDSPIPAGDETYEPSGIAVLFVIAYIFALRRYVNQLNPVASAQRKRFGEMHAQYKPAIEAEADEVRKAGGLVIIGTGRHESRRQGARQRSPCSACPGRRMRFDPRH